MGCCGNNKKDIDIERAQNIDELINVMSKKKDNLSIESTQISNYLADPQKEITIIRIDMVTKTDLEKRIPYLKKLSECYADIIERLTENPKLPLQETKEHLNNILQHYYLSFDQTESYKNDLEKFKDFIYKQKKKD